MFNIQDYLKKFRVMTSNEGTVKDATVAVLKEECDIDIDRDAVQYHNKQVFIRAHPIIKNQIATRKPAIRSKLRAQLDCVVHDIR